MADLEWATDEEDGIEGEDSEEESEASITEKDVSIGEMDHNDLPRLV